MIAHQCQQALNVCEQVYCVLGFEQARIAKAIEHLPVTTIANESWHLGLSSSIAEAVNNLPDDINGVLLLLVDQWKTTSFDLQKLKDLWLSSPEFITCAEKQSLQGPPVIFPREFFPQLVNLSKGSGAKSIIKNNLKQVKTVVMEHAFIDLDTPAQLEQMEKELNNI